MRHESKTSEKASGGLDSLASNRDLMLSVRKIIQPVFKVAASNDWDEQSERVMKTTELRSDKHRNSIKLSEMPSQDIPIKTPYDIEYPTIISPSEKIRPECLIIPVDTNPHH